MQTLHVGHVGADLGEFHVHDLVQRLLSVVSDPYAAFPSLDSDPFVLFRVIEVFRNRIVRLQF